MLEDFFEFDLTRFRQPTVIVGLIIMALAIILSATSGVIAQKIMAKSQLNKNTQQYINKEKQTKIIIKAISLAIALVGVLVAVLFIK